MLKQLKHLGSPSASNKNTNRFNHRKRPLKQGGRFATGFSVCYRFLRFIKHPCLYRIGEFGGEGIVPLGALYPTVYLGYPIPYLLSEEVDEEENPTADDEGNSYAVAPALTIF